MSGLASFPVVNQLDSQTFDGRPDENRWFNCVLASFVAVILYYRPDLAGTLSPDSLKDAVKGEGYTGGTDIRWFIPFVQKHYNVTVTAYNATVAFAVQMGHQQVLLGHPVVVTEIDPYVDTALPQYAGWTHVVVWCRERPGFITCMDPFGGKFIEKSDAQWETDLHDPTLWIGDRFMHLYTTAARDFGSWFTATDATHWLCKHTGVVVHDAILAAYVALSVDGQTLPVIGLPTHPEVYVTVKGVKISLQPFERGGLCWDPAHVKDSQPGMGDVYLVKLDDPDLLSAIPGLVLPTGNATVGLPPGVAVDIKANLALAQKLAHDSGLD